MLGAAERVLQVEHHLGPAIGSQLLLGVFCAFVAWRCAWLLGAWAAKKAPRRSGGPRGSDGGRSVDLVVPRGWDRN